MPVLKFPSGTYLNPDAVEKEINYVFGKALATGGRAVDPEHAADQMQMVKTVWGQHGGKQLHHFILSFSDYESQRINGVSDLLALGYDISLLFSGEYQIVFGVHCNQNYHLHFVMNSVSYCTGKKFVHSKAEDTFLAEYIRECSIPRIFHGRITSRYLSVYYC